MNDLSIQKPFVQATPQNNALVTLEGDKAESRIKAMVTLAIHNPRDESRCIEKILNTCQRPALAEISHYSFSRAGTEITGPSIDLIDAVAQLWKNITSGWKELQRHDDYSDCVSFAWDLENNTYQEIDFKVPHYREGKAGKRGARVTADRDIYELCANMAARRRRTCLENILPADVVQIASEECNKTLEIKEKVTPESIKVMLEALNKFGVTRAQVEKRIQRSMEALTPAQMVSLRRIYHSLNNKIGDVADFFEIIEKAEEVKKPKGMEALKERVAAPTALERVETPNITPEAKVLPPLINVELDAANKPLWTDYKNRMVAELVNIKTIDELGIFQQVNLKNIDALRSNAPSVNDELVKAFTAKYSELLPQTSLNLSE